MKNKTHDRLWCKKYIVSRTEDLIKTTKKNFIIDYIFFTQTEIAYNYRLYNISN